MEAAAVVTIVAIVLVVLVLVFYLVSTILELRKITAGLDVVIGAVGEIVAKSEPVNGIVKAINADLAAGTSLLEGLLEKKAGPDDAAGLIESVFPGGGAAVLKRQGRQGPVKNIDEVYTRGAVQLARLGRESPIGAGAASGAALRDAEYSSAAARSLYSKPGGVAIPRSPVIGTGAEPYSDASLPSPVLSAIEPGSEAAVDRVSEEEEAAGPPAEQADVEVSRDAGDRADAVVNAPPAAEPGEKDEPDMKDMGLGSRPIDDQTAQ